MPKSTNKTKPTTKTPASFIAGLKDPEQQRDARALVKLMQAVSGAKPRMWGPSMIGFGEHHYKYPSGREGDIFVIGFSPRKPDLVFYQLAPKTEAALVKQLGKCKLGGGCVYVRRLDDIHLPTLKKLLQKAVKRSKKSAAG